MSIEAVLYRKGPIRFVLCFGIPLFLTSSAFGVLGEDVSSVTTDQSRLQASARVFAASSYNVHEMRTPAGTTIREYVLPSGTVFAVSWRGFSPNLKQLLGNHFDEYVAAAGQQSRRRQGVHLDTGDLVVETGGHMRFTIGRAVLRSKLPPGVDGDELQ